MQSSRSRISPTPSCPPLFAYQREERRGPAPASPRLPTHGTLSIESCTVSIHIQKCKWSLQLSKQRVVFCPFQSSYFFPLGFIYRCEGHGKKWTLTLSIPSASSFIMGYKASRTFSRPALVVRDMEREVKKGGLEVSRSCWLGRDATHSGKSQRGAELATRRKQNENLWHMMGRKNFMHSVRCYDKSRWARDRVYGAFCVAISYCLDIWIGMHDRLVAFRCEWVITKT